MMLDGASSGAIPALVGAAIGGLSSFAGSWLTQWLQLRDRRIEIERARREVLFGEFITEAARLYGDALTHEKDDVADLSRLYALVGRIRLTGSNDVLHCAEQTMTRIIDTYLAPNRTLHEMRILAAEGGMNFLLAFSEAARADLKGYERGTPRKASRP